MNLSNEKIISAAKRCLAEALEMLDYSTDKDLKSISNRIESLYDALSELEQEANQ